MVGGWPDQGGVTCAAAAMGNLRHRPSFRSDWTPLCSIWRGDVEGLRHTRLFQTIQCPCARKLERARAVDAISARDFGQFPSEVSVTIQTAEFDPRNSEFRFLGCNYDIQTAPLNLLSGIFLSQIKDMALLAQCGLCFNIRQASDL
jgi:hypothetical protein